MKNIFNLMFLLLMMIRFASAQDTVKNQHVEYDVPPPPPPPLSDTNQAFSYVEIMPDFPGGKDSLNSFIKRNLQYPDIAKDMGIQGTVFSTFVVDRDGSLKDIKILRPMNPPCIACDSEVLRVIKKMPKFKPGKQNGKVVRVKFNLPVKFSLQ